MRLTNTFFVLALLSTAACDADFGSLERAHANFDVADPRPEAFFICGSHGCEERLPISLTAKEWRHAQAPFRTRPRSARAERAALAEALRRLEVTVGHKTGYNADKARSVLQFDGKSQDCVDEMVNTAVYLKLLDDAGHLLFHRPGQRVTLGFMTRNFWTHTVATIFQRDSGQEFVVETWAVDFGELPYIMDRADWANNAPFRRDY